MRALSDYTIRDWLKGAPFAHRFRRARNLLVDRVYGGRRADGQAALVERLAASPAASLAFTVAFNMPDAITLLADAMARFVPQSELVVCDNSTDPAARAAIAALCRDRGIAYCPLPPSPYRGGRNGSRSHAVALNWILHNLIRPAAPRVFALLDHDLIPLSPADLAAQVTNRPCYGLVRTAVEGGAVPRGGEKAWYLWPGYSVFDFEAVRTLPLDFSTDTPLGLDTGGQNWSVLYHRLERRRIAAAARGVVIADPATGDGQPHLLVDGWLHAGGAGHAGKVAFAAVRRAWEEDPEGLLARLTEMGKRGRARG